MGRYERAALALGLAALCAFDTAAAGSPPVNQLPAAQTTPMNVVLRLSAATGNGVSVTDSDVVDNLMTVTMSSTGGGFRMLGLAAGTHGQPLEYFSMSGPLDSINEELDSLRFFPARDFIGTATIVFTTYEGLSGGTEQNSVLEIEVTPASAHVVDVYSDLPDGHYAAGTEIPVTLEFDVPMEVDPLQLAPQLRLETGATDRIARYVSGTGTHRLVFKYVVQAGDASADLDYASTAAFDLHAATIHTVGGGGFLVALPEPGSAGSLGAEDTLVVDTQAPAATAVSSTPSRPFAIGDAIDVTVQYDEPVVVEGTPRIPLVIGPNGPAHADYLSGSGTAQLTFRFLATATPQYFGGPGPAIDANGGSIEDFAGNAASLGLPLVAPGAPGGAPASTLPVPSGSAIASAFLVLALAAFALLRRRG